MLESVAVPLSPPKSGVRTLTARLRWVLPVMLVLGSPFALWRLILDHMVNIPFLDDWMFVKMFQHERMGTLTLHDFFVVQMEHRMALVRAVILLLHKLWPTDYTKQMIVGWLLLVGTYANVAWLMRKTIGGGFRRWWPLLTMAGTALFSPIQYRIVLWAMMFQVACPGFFLSTTLVALLSRWPLWLRWLVGVVCASCATQTFATGILVWLLPLPLIFWGGAFRNRRSQYFFTGAWLLAFGVTMALYFTNLKNEVDPAFAYKQGEEDSLHHDTGAFFVQPGRSIPYVLRFLGQHLGRGSSFAMMDASLAIGLLSLLLFLGACAWFVVNFKCVELRQRLLPWLLFGSYSIGAGVLVAMGRLWASHNGDNALAARYVIHAIPLTVSLIAVGWIIGRDWLERHPDRDRVPLRIIQTAFISLYLGLQTLSWAHGCRLMELWESSRLRGAANVLFYKALPQIEDLVPGTRDYAKAADDLGLLAPPMLKNLKLENFTRSTDPLSINTAQWSSLTMRKDESGARCVFNGYACLPRRARTADGIFFSTKNKITNDWEIFYVAQVSAMPLYLMDTLSRDTQFIHLGGELQKQGVGGFSGQFNLSLVPPGIHRVAAWAFDYKQHKVYLMRGYYEIDTERGAVLPLGDDPAAVKLGNSRKKKNEK